ncbi:DUF481 domain-containing protein [Sulfuriroseicoccus oceanibius]|uniref:DUF481 domain-containing protein n=1 Tax=Sulfuriroseicoccus oceanibius TaxID=2707525 RepID=A0A6B3L366_9BACT|nr:DUF481 domain-containing protein [Sulfuriroseicoccus oceanibius]QQL45266.1 DUF481 domain-containing protein [Sulfuriroseicoccus oceanibius]
MTRSILLSATTCLFGGIVSVAPALAEVPVTQVKKPAPLEITAAGSLSASSGNSDSFTSGLQGMATWLGDSHELVLGADYLYGENSEETTTDTIRAFGNFRWTVSDRMYVGARAGYLHDPLADLEYRTQVLPKVGYDVIKNDRVTLSLEGGLGYLWEDKGGVSDHYVAGLLGQRFKYQLTDRTQFWQSAGFVPEFGDFSNYQLEAEAGLTTRLSDFWALRFSGRGAYDNTPAAGAETTDLVLMTAVEYAIGGFQQKPSPKKRRTLFKAAGGSSAPKMGWDSSAGAGVTVSDGNAETVTLTGGYDVAFRSASNEWFFDIDASYSKDEVSTTLQKTAAEINYKWLFGPRWYAGANFGFLHDDLAGVAYRMTPSALAGAYLLKNDAMTFSLDGGPGYTFESVDDDPEGYVSVFVGQRFTWELIEGVTLKQSLSAVGNPSDVSDYHLDGSARLDVRLIGNLMLRSGVTWTYINEPTRDRKKSDVLVTGGFAYRF